MVASKKSSPDQPFPNEFIKSYMSKLQERIFTLKTLIKLNTKKTSEIVTLNFLNTMWKELVLQS